VQTVRQLYISKLTDRELIRHLDGPNDIKIELLDRIINAPHGPLKDEELITNAEVQLSEMIEALHREMGKEKSELVSDVVRLQNENKAMGVLILQLNERISELEGKQ
jgi:hypothetical protein